ncbi:MAG TPA: amidohydrolase family protein [Acidimicrobiales bacterium]|jgi:hypothetical protein
MDDPGLPIKLGPVSNSEYDPPPTTEVVREAVKRARRMAEENARRIGMDRRRFLLSSMGAATTLYALAACSSDSKGKSSAKDDGGTYDIPPDAMVDPDVALDTLGSDQPIIDVQTHLLEYPNDYTGFHLGSIWQGAKDCGDKTLFECFNTETWIEEVFGRSDTTVAVLSALPTVGAFDPQGNIIDPLSAQVMDQGREQLTELCGDGRVLVHGHAWVNVGELPAAFVAMEEELDRFPLIAWKTYTHVGDGFSLDDHMGLPIGEAYLSKVEEIGPPIVCVHKGFGSIGDAPFADPADIGPAAKNHPDLSFVVYHSGFEPGIPEGPYDTAAPNGGVDRLIKTLESNNIAAGGNVYAELGSTWKVAMGQPEAAAHILGKLLKAVGEDRLVWGTDSIWYGSPQDQIQAFRSFKISEEFQETYGYPELTDEIKHKILWRNSAKLYNIDVARVPCEVDAAGREEARMSTSLGNWTYGPQTATASRRQFMADHPWAFLR